MKDRLIIVVLATSLALSGFLMFSFFTEQRETSVLPLRVPSPILLIHGLGESADGWAVEGLVDYLVQAGLGYGRVLGVAEDGDVERVGGGGSSEIEPADFYSLEISNPYQTLEDWSREIAAAVAAVREETRAPRVVLVGFSAGGVAARTYVTERLEDHHVARLVTVASPHRGSELALLARLYDELQRDDSLRLLRRPLLNVLDDLRRARGIVGPAPLLLQLLPPEHGGYLAGLNRSEHPSDVEYSCVLTSGSPGPSDARSLQAEIVRARSNGAGVENPLIERLLTSWMRWMARGTGNESSRGDGAVLESSQNLGGVEFFRQHPQLLREVRTAPASHGEARSSYSEILDAISGDVDFLAVRKAGGSQAALELDFHQSLAGLSAVSVKDAEGRTIPVSEPRIVLAGGRTLARVEIGPLPADVASPLEVLVEPPGSRVSYGARLVTGARGLRASRSGGVEPASLELHRAWGIDSDGWDRVGAPDVMVVVFVNGEERWRSAVHDEVRNQVELVQAGRLDLSPSTDRVVLELWDVDSAVSAERMGRVVWNPGRMPWGHAVVGLDSGMAIELDLLPPDGIVWGPELRVGS